MNLTIHEAQITYHLGKANKDEVCIKSDFTPATAIDPASEDVTIAIRVGNDRGLETNAFRVKKDRKTGIPVKLLFF